MNKHNLSIINDKISEYEIPIRKYMSNQLNVLEADKVETPQKNLSAKNYSITISANTESWEISSSLSDLFQRDRNFLEEIAEGNTYLILKGVMQIIWSESKEIEGFRRLYRTY